MRFGSVVVAVIALALASGTSAFSVSTFTWRVVKSKSASGQFAVTAISATVRHPRGLAVRFRGAGAQGEAVWACSKGYSVASWTHSYGPGFHALGHVRGKDSCNVVASVSGEGRVTVQILALR
jgi:hypothetical protein